MQQDTESSARAVARKRVEARLGLAVHWVVYLAVNTGLVVASGGLEGSGWRIAGWGLGLIVHTGYVAFDAAGWRERLVDRELAREAGRSQ